MKKLLMLVAVAVVAAAMYVAAASGSQQSAGPTAKQFNALKKQVATLSKTLKTTKAEATLALHIEGCYLTVSGNTLTFNVLPVSQFGTATSGFLFGAPNTPTGQTARSALDVNASSPSANLQEVSTQCVSGALKHNQTDTGIHQLQLWAERTR